MKRRPKIAICIPAYNEERYIYSSIMSALNQTYKNFIIHIFDNVSTDDTLKIIKKIKDPRLVIHKYNKHVSMFENMNRCLTVKNIDYIKILCADDLLEKTC